jgi:hypothetical protein
VVLITDKLSAKTLTGSVPSERFKTIAGPTYGTAYRGVAYVAEACQDDHRFDRDDCDEHHHDDRR